MDLFNSNTSQNLLPFDGEVVHHGFLLNNKMSQVFFKSLFDKIPWKQDELVIFGKRVITDRKIAWFGDSNYAYSYANVEKEALPWTSDLLVLKQLVESQTDELFNSCLLNLYHNGNEGMSWHSDDEKELGEKPIIASLSLGAVRKFSLKHKASKQKIDLILESGSLLLMKGETQNNWVHSLPKSKKIKNPRINLTFRYIYL